MRRSYSIFEDPSLGASYLYNLFRSSMRSGLVDTYDLDCTSSDW